jgi:hypothetical protein
MGNTVILFDLPILPPCNPILHILEAHWLSKASTCLFLALLFVLAYIAVVVGLAWPNRSFLCRLLQAGLQVSDGLS